MLSSFSIQQVLTIYKDAHLGKLNSENYTSPSQCSMLW